MDFKLCYKSYEFKDSFNAVLEFDRETGRDLWAVLQGVQNLAMAHSQGSVRELTHAIGEYIGVLHGAKLLWVLAKECNSTLKLSEIQDAVRRVGSNPVDHDDLFGQPYTVILYKLANDIANSQMKECKQAKKDLSPS